MLARDHPNINTYAVVLGSTQYDLGDVVKNRGQPEAALSWYGQAIATLEAVLAKEARAVKARQSLLGARLGRAEGADKAGPPRRRTPRLEPESRAFRRINSP